MIAMNLPEKTIMDLIYYTNEFIDNACSQKFIREAETNKSRLKKVIGRVMVKPKRILNDFRLKGTVKKLT
ncbi:MAG: hypothetical protein KAW56_07095 [Candidatus Marinimicrobia bacterium]|nr:hypothetical protein [Candidatus Neomarinimicrobiota bacterium]